MELLKSLIVNIRKSKLRDLGKLLQFEQALIAFERPFDKSFKDNEITYYNLEKLITDENSELVVAELDGKIIGSGCASLKKSEPFEKHENFCYLGFMYVEPSYRRKGINRKILNSLIDWSKSKGLVEIRLEVYDKNKSAISAYEKFGFNKTTVKMRIEIESLPASKHQS